MKTLPALLAISALVLTGRAQGPPGAPPAVADNTNAPAVPAPGPSNIIRSATNAPTINTNQLEAIRKQLQEAITNRMSRAATNRTALPLLPGAATNATPAPAVNAAPAPLPLPGAAAGTPAGQLAVPGAPPALAAPQASAGAATNVAGASERAEHILKFNNAPPDQIFEKYSELTGRTVLRPAALPAAAVTIITYSPLTREEAIQAIDGALALNSITMIPQGEKFVKAVPSVQAPPEGAAISHKKASELPEAEQFLTHVVQLKVVKPSELAQLFTSFTKNPGGIVPIDSSQILVIRDYASNIKRMLELIEKVDVPPESDYKLEVIPIKYGKVTDLFGTMNALISGAGGGGAFAGSTATTQRRGQLGTTGPGGRYGAQTGRLGQPGGVQSQQFPGAQPVTQPGATPATSFQNRLNQIVSRAAGESQIQVLGDARIVPDERSNSLIVFANKQDFQMITNIVAKVDQLLAQVLIEAIILEVQVGDTFKLGVSAAQSQKRVGDFTGAGGFNNGQAFFNGLTNFPGALPDGFSYFGKIGNTWDVALAAIATDSNAKVVSRPRLQTSHAVPGNFFIGETVPYITGTYDYGFGTGIGSRSQYTEKQIGINLDVTPFITPEGLVVMEITQNFDSRGADVIVDGNPVPIVNNRQASAMLTVRDGDAIMLGGFISQNKTRGKSGVPFLKDIPLLGALFRTKTSENKRTELIVLMRATVLKDPEAAADIVRQEKDRLPGVREAEKEFNILEGPQHKRSVKHSNEPAEAFKP
jgi:general secretion pathway protein D